MTLKVRLKLKDPETFSINDLRTKLRSEGYTVEIDSGKLVIAQTTQTAFLRTSGGFIMAVPASVEAVDNIMLISFTLNPLIGTAVISLVAGIAGLVVRTFNAELGLVMAASGALVLIIATIAYLSNVSNVRTDLKNAISMKA